MVPRISSFKNIYIYITGLRLLIFLVRSFTSVFMSHTDLYFFILVVFVCFQYQDYAVLIKLIRESCLGGIIRVYMFQ